MASNGIAGEFYVAAELTKRGMIATITGKNTKDIDIIAANPNTGKTVLVQVKEKSLNNKSPEWVMGEVKTSQVNMDVWYIFVDLANYECHIISARELAPIVKKRQDDYNNGVNKNGKPRVPEKTRFYFNRNKDMLDANGNVKVNNWEDLPIF